jgi:site-specific DNA recombinase
MNCVFYARVSTDRQAEKELSIPAQLEAMREYARQRDWTVSEEFLEPGASGKSSDRPALQRLLTAIRQAQSSINVVLVHKIDRLARNVFDHATIRALLKQHGIRLASVVENVDESVSGELVENIMASIAQFYSSNLSEEVKKGMRQKVLKGGWPHLAPCGYVQVKGSGETASHIEVHPRLGPLIAQGFERFASGLYSPKRLTKLLAEKGLVTKTGGPLSPAHLREILGNPFYAGRIRWNGLDVAGTHEPLVAVEVFAKAQRLLTHRSRTRGRKGRLTGVPLRGVAICAACRGHMTAERQERWTYYRCSRQAYRRDLCPARFCNADRAHAALKLAFLQIQITRETARTVGKAVRRALEKRMTSAKREDTAARMKELVALETTLTEHFTASEIPPKEYASKSAELRQQQAEVLIRQKSLETDPQELSADIDRVLRVATSLWDVYEPLPDRQRADLVRMVFSAVTLNAEGIVGFSLTEPFKALQAHDGRSSDDVAQHLIELYAAVAT